MKVDWEAAENELFAAIKNCVIDFAKEHPDEQFYGFFLDCNARHFEVLGHLNTESKLQERATAFREAWQDEHPDWKINDFIEHLRWEAGDWGYFEIFNAEFDGGLTDALQEIAESGKPEKYRDQFLESCCKVVLRLDREDAFAGLKKTPNFRVLCVDHDEKVQEGDARLEKTRARVV